MPTTIAPEPAAPPSAVAPRLSVVMPAYNEADNIADAIDDVIGDVFRVMPEAELVVVDDGSRDRTEAIARECALRDRRVRVVTQANAGHGPAVVRGVRESRGEWCLLLDSDRQIALASFGETWRLAQGRDAVLGVRRVRADPRHRLVLSAALRLAMGLVLGVRSSDPNVPYKLVRRDCVLAAIEAMPAHPRIPSVLITVYLAHRGHRTVEQPVAHRRRVAGETTLRFARLARLCREATAELLRFRRALGPRA